MLGFSGKNGNKTVLLSYKDIVPALKNGKIDAAELTSLDRDITVGLHEFAKYNYYPGWFQQSATAELIMNLKKEN